MWYSMIGGSVQKNGICRRKCAHIIECALKMHGNVKNHTVHANRAYMHPLCGLCRLCSLIIRIVRLLGLRINEFQSRYKTRPALNRFNSSALHIEPNPRKQNQLLPNITLAPNFLSDHPSPLIAPRHRPSTVH